MWKRYNKTTLLTSVVRRCYSVVGKLNQQNKIKRWCFGSGYCGQHRWVHLNSFTNVFAIKMNLTNQIIAADICSTLGQFYFICLPLSNQKYKNVQWDLMFEDIFGFWACCMPYCSAKKSQLFSLEHVQGKQCGNVSDMYIFWFHTCLYPTTFDINSENKFVQFLWGDQAYEAWFSQQETDFSFLCST